MCLPPFVVSCRPESVIRHLRKVLAAAEIPQVIQYAATLTGTQIDPGEILKLKREFSHLACIKVDFIPPGPAISGLVSLLDGESFRYLVGYSGLQLPDALARGAQGLMGGAGHAVEDLLVFGALREDPRIGYLLFEKLLPMLNFEMQTLDLCVAVHKRLLRDQGIFTSDESRAPGIQLDQFQETELARHKNNLSSLVEQAKKANH